jgi:hypothetical protein
VQAAAAGAQGADSPLGLSIVRAGLHDLTSAIAGLFHGDEPAAPPAAAPGAAPGAPPVAPQGPASPPGPTPPPVLAKDAVTNLQRALNQLGASPPLHETGTMTPETIAAIKAAQITFGLVADGVPAAKTTAAVAIALDPQAQAAILPSLPKAADHVATVAAAAAPEAAEALQAAALALKGASAATPSPTDTQTHASTAASMAATAASAAPPAIAVPLAAATNALANAATTSTPNPATLATAAMQLATASQATGGATGMSLQLAADHVNSASASSSVGDIADHLNAAAQHLSNASAGTPAPVTAAVGADLGLAPWQVSSFGTELYMGWASGGFGADLGLAPYQLTSFGWDFGSFWKGFGGLQRFLPWHRRLHPAYRPPIPGALPAAVAVAAPPLDSNAAAVAASQTVAADAGPAPAPTPQYAPGPQYAPAPQYAYPGGGYPGGAGPYAGLRRLEHAELREERILGHTLGDHVARFMGEFSGAFAPVRPAAPVGQGAPPPPPGHPSAMAYYEARNRTIGRGGFDDRFDAHHYRHYGQWNPWASSAPPVAGFAPNPMAAVDPNAINPYVDPNADGADVGWGGWGGRPMPPMPPGGFQPGAGGRMPYRGNYGRERRHMEMEALAAQQQQAGIPPQQQQQMDPNAINPYANPAAPAQAADAAGN